ncbi:uncharacterized protein LAESUDRAFT_337767 [Laetiporus sulphureus 93-53]|uniref:DUF6533 domain-containing protein n=1 Tax=Laetiporus sulphureus 93-53 TaxID=1314785 RepID=A0A165CWD7_9APHY|nr:uncharacterized protein LAESUDRAFT_337767 [Laetiporus sulphureus 93-53]KZT03572.1 hypothetical protein LAESUDRAFT_337767 [Laetiporus sulphureus 93-53]
MSASAVSETYRLDGVFITCVYYASAALCSYDYLLTFSEEVQYIWKSKFSFTTVLFCGFRYPVLLNTVFLILGLPSWRSWQNDYLYHRYPVSNGPISHHYVECCAIHLPAGLCHLQPEYMAFADRPKSHPSSRMHFYLHCDLHYAWIIRLPWAASLRCQLRELCSTREVRIIGARIALVVADALVLALTWLKTYRLRNADRMLETTTLSAALFTGCTLSTSSLLCIANVIAIAIASINTLIFPMNAWLAVLTSVLLSRLLFHLREVSSKDSSKDSTMSTAVSSTVVFQDSHAIRMRVLSHSTIEVDDGGYVTDECDV